MARSIAVIEAQIISEKNSQSVLNNLNSPSRVAIYRTWIFIQAVTINLFEQILDIHKAALETLLSKAPPATPLWIQKKAFEFQYDPSANPNTNIVQIFPDFSVGYITVDPQFRVISQCSVTSDYNNNVLIKIATGSPPGSLGSAQVIQAGGYFSAIMPAGIYSLVSSLDSDKLYVQANVYYDGLYANTIQTSVEAALDNYLSMIPFDGSIKVSEIETTILSVEGVKDVNILKINARADTTSFSSGTTIYELSAGKNLRFWNTIAGYIVQETTSGQTFADSILYIPQ